jgi:hypothetical protein
MRAVLVAVYARFLRTGAHVLNVRSAPVLENHRYTA